MSIGIAESFCRCQSACHRSPQHLKRRDSISGGGSQSSLSGIAPQMYRVTQAYIRMTKKICNVVQLWHVSPFLQREFFSFPF
jgi:hypothetical protein